MTKAPILALENISKSYRMKAEKIDVLKNVSLSIEAGESLGLMGPSGCGKSTLLNIVGLLDQADTGYLTLDQTHIQQGSSFKKIPDSLISRLRMEELGFVFQFHHLLSDFTALENIMIPMTLSKKLPKKQRQERALYLLEELGLSSRKNHYPLELSGGERQRVAIARALANEPSLILADEPTGNLDEDKAQEVFNLFMQIAREENRSILVVSHNQALLESLDKVYCLRQGCLDVWL